MTTEHVSVPRELALDAVNALKETGRYTKCLALQAILSRATPSDVRCTTCDGTGDVHRADGEWLGECTACDAKKTSAPRVVTDEDVERFQEVYDAEWDKAVADDPGSTKGTADHKATRAAIESFATSLPAVPDGFIVVPMPNPEEMEALRSFAATAADDESYTVSRELMSRLLLFGAVYRAPKRDWYYLTDFGRCLLAAAPQAGES